MKRLKRKTLARRGLAVLLIAALGLAGCSAGSAAGMEEQAASAAGGLFRKPSNAGAKVSDFLKGGASSKPSSGSAEKPAQTPKPTPEPTPKPSGAVLPSAQSFSGNKMIANDEDSRTPWYSAYTNEEFVEEYVALVQGYGFTLRDSAKDSTGTTRYVFDYAGSGTVGTFDAPQGKFDKKGVALYIAMLPFNSGTMELKIRFGSGVTYMETSERATVQVSAPAQSSGGGSSGGSGSSSGGSSSGGSSGVQVKCSKCSGTGSIACTNCDGKGYKEKVVSTANYSGKSGSTTSRSRETCYKCHGSGSISCTRCGGSGKQ